MVLPATLETVRPDGSSERIAAWTFDLSPHGVGLFVEAPLVRGEIVRVIVEDGPSSRKRLRNWSGRVVNVYQGGEGIRLGVSFDDPDAGPSLFYSFQKQPDSNRASLLRVDPPWSETAPRPVQEPARHSERRLFGGSGTSLLIFQAIAFLGFVADQAAKALAFSTSRGFGTPVKNFGSLGGGRAGIPFEPEILTFLALALTGVVARWALQSRGDWKPLDALGWGCLFAGLLGNAVDRLTLGFVRDFLQSTLLPSWIFNLADLLAVLGAFFLMLSWALVRRAPSPSRPSSREGASLATENLRVI
ncbi:MAG: hypothetical protein NVSMB14_00360 [Isosphaeraceae bacterium]